MIEVRVSIEAPELSEAIVKLANALTVQSGRAIALTGAVAGSTQETAVCSPVEAHTTVPEVPAKPEPTPTPVEPAKVSTSEQVTTPAPEQAAASAVHYTTTQLGRAGAELMSKGKTKELVGLLGKFGVKALTELKPESYPAFAEGLIQLGAVIPAEAA